MPPTLFSRPFFRLTRIVLSSAASEAEWLGWLRAILADVLAALFADSPPKGVDLDCEQSLEAQFLEPSSSRLESLLAADQTSPSERVVRAEDLFRLANALSVCRRINAVWWNCITSRDFRLPRSPPR